MKIKFKHIIIVILALIVILFFINMIAVNQFMKTPTVVG